jgi:hypothetical protein
MFTHSSIPMGPKKYANISMSPEERKEMHYGPENKISFKNSQKAYFYVFLDAEHVFTINKGPQTHGYREKTNFMLFHLFL